MISAWTQHLRDENEKERFKDRLLRSKEVLERLSDILKKEEDEITNRELNPNSFGSASWPYEQAFLCGKRAQLKTITKLLDLKENNDR